MSTLTEGKYVRIGVVSSCSGGKDVELIIVRISLTPRVLRGTGRKKGRKNQPKERQTDRQICNDMIKLIKRLSTSVQEIATLYNFVSNYCRK